MKKIVSILFVLFFAGAFLHTSAQNGNKLGIRAGYQSSSWHKDGSQLTGTDPYSSFYVGLFRDNKIIPAVHIGLGLEYFQAGATMDNDRKQVLNYLSVPAYLKVKLGPLFALAGVGANFKVGEKVYTGSSSAAPSASEKSKTFDCPFIAGAGVKILMFTIEARYHRGLVKINDAGASNQYLQLGAAVSF
jgi:hypothetical protein